MSHTDYTKRVRRPKGLKAISQKLHRRKLAATIRRVHSACNTDSKGEATCLREICEICVRPKSMMQENFAFFREIRVQKKSAMQANKS